jgi:hypothetical protein
MMDRLIGKYRIWHFAYTCRHNPERIGIELRRLLVELRGAELRAQALDQMLSEREGTVPGALGAVAASRWNITNSAEITRVFESLTDEQKGRLRSAVSLKLPGRRD